MKRPARSSTRSPRAAAAAGTTFASGLFRRLRHATIRGELRPGDRLVELEVARQYGLSRASAREALKLLEREGFVKAIPGRGYVVPAIAVRQIKELFDPRLLLFDLGLDVRDRADALIQEHRDLVAVVRAGDAELASRLAST
ncbi:MAG: GntR family transcriptional regulator [Armatimonadota bacterium]|nr:GntR family transcriptional regulator [Armatimonadota bacterium]MDR7485657.1 GntR family transcriptional regulator [Armatimonadota bacterium]MDR7534306.1 GntR family transcriptional regulator [Armatimonadota bacterium]MDR7535918.1 GntR family transcriptional regulator [Armatimonadota bacterium]